MTKGLRVVGILAMAFAIAHCGDSDVRVSTGPGVVPAPGTFTGSLSDGGSIRIEVGSIEEVSFDCDDEEIQETFTPPRDIEPDGTFNVKFSDGGRDFRVRGTFRDNNVVDGTIDDEDNECDVSYDATRGGGPIVTSTPARTPTGVQPTATPGVVATDTPAPGEPTLTPGGGGPTFTPGGGGGPTTTRTATPAPSGSPCPVGVEVLGDAGSAKVLDTGWTGIAHRQSIIQDGKLTFTLDCANDVRPCGTCQVSGPIQNLKPDQGDINPRRCSNDTSTKCTTNAQCTGGTCVFFFGAPLPLSAGGVSTCVTNRVDGSVIGTANVENGTFASEIHLLSSVFLNPSVPPCPRCIGDGAVNDGTKGGTCSGGTKNGQACDGNGRSPLEAFGTTSLDCPPAGTPVSTLPINLKGSSGVETLTHGASDVACTGVGFSTKKCFCAVQGVNDGTRPNACDPDGICTAVAGSTNLGICAETIDQNCKIETFNGCIGNEDCPAPGDECVNVNRPCYLDNGDVGGSVTAIGMADPPTNGQANPTLGALFCVAKTGSSAINTTAGLPGLGRIELPLSTKEILTLPAP